MTVETTYTADGQIATLTARNPTTGDQVTTYVYGTTLDDSDIARSDLVRAEIYPDSDDVAEPLGDGDDEVYDRVQYTYNRQGQRTGKQDQNGTVHAFVYDDLGRVLHDRVTTLGTDIDSAVLRTSTSYEVRGMVASITHYDHATVGSGSVVNEVVYQYHDLGMLEKEYQEHEGAKDANTLYVAVLLRHHHQRRQVHPGPAAHVAALSQRPAGALYLRRERQYGRCLEPSGRHPGR